MRLIRWFSDIWFCWCGDPMYCDGMCPNRPERKSDAGNTA